MIDIDKTRYDRVTRERVLQILERADIKPDRFTAHRDKTFTAKYLRARQTQFVTHRYEEQLEIAADNCVAIFKRPSTRMDKGPYITLKFAVASLDKLGLAKIELNTDGTAKAVAVDSKPTKKRATRKNGTKKAVVAAAPVEAVKPTHAQVLTKLTSVSGDMKQLVAFAHELVEKEKADNLEADRKQILVVLDELKKHIETVATGLVDLAASNGKA